MFREWRICPMPQRVMQPVFNNGSVYTFPHRQWRHTILGQCFFSVRAPCTCTMTSHNKDSNNVTRVFCRLSQRNSRTVFSVRSVPKNYKRFQNSRGRVRMSLVEFRGPWLTEQEMARRLHSDLKCEFLCLDPLAGDHYWRQKILVLVQGWTENVLVKVKLSLCLTN
jgi:hypothetical protein